MAARSVPTPPVQPQPHPRRWDIEWAQAHDLSEAQQCKGCYNYTWRVVPIVRTGADEPPESLDVCPGCADIVQNLVRILRP